MIQTLEQLQKTEWYQTRPQVIKEAIDICFPYQTYRFKESKKQCYIISYDEPESGKVEDVTVTVQKTGSGGVLDDIGLAKVLDTNQVTGVLLSDLELVPNEEV